MGWPSTYGWYSTGYTSRNADADTSENIPFFRRLLCTTWVLILLYLLLPEDTFTTACAGGAGGTASAAMTIPMSPLYSAERNYYEKDATARRDWLRMMQLAKDGEDMKKVVDLCNSQLVCLWRVDLFAQEFVRCQQLALEVFGNYAKYNITRMTLANPLHSRPPAT